jgi:hypothetical protein
VLPNNHFGAKGCYFGVKERGITANGIKLSVKYYIQELYSLAIVMPVGFALTGIQHNDGLQPIFTGVLRTMLFRWIPACAEMTIKSMTYA